MSAEKNNLNSASQKEALSKNSDTVQGDIYVQDVHKYFGVTRALNGVNFSANFGEIHAIVGGNGCGKSTLAKVMSGVLPIDKGKVSVLGHTPTSPVMARNMGIATVFQEVMIAEEASVVDNLFVGSDDFWYKNLTQREKVIKAQEIMEDLVGEYVDPYTQAFNLSLPIKAWITIARAFLRENTKVLILDESSAALDFDSTERLFKKMRELRDNGVAVFIVTHRIAELVRISDKATVMRDGKDVFSRDFKTIMQPLLSEVNVNTDINIEDRTLWRAKANLLFPTCDRQLQHSLPHIDSNDEHQTIIYYVTDSDGDTLLFEDDKKTIVKRISPKKGRFLFFDGDIWHASTNPVKSMKRIVININLSVL